MLLIPLVSCQAYILRTAPPIFIIDCSICSKLTREQHIQNLGPHFDKSILSLSVPVYRISMFASVSFPTATNWEYYYLNRKVSKCLRGNSAVCMDVRCANESRLVFLPNPKELNGDASGPWNTGGGMRGPSARNGISVNQ